MRSSLAEPPWRTLVLEDHVARDEIPPHPSFASRYRKAKGGTLEDARKAEQDAEKRIAKRYGLTHPARLSGDIMAREKDAYLESLEPKKG